MRWTVLTLVLLAAACGDDGSPADPGADAGLDTGLDVPAEPDGSDASHPDDVPDGSPADLGRDTVDQDREDADVLEDARDLDAAPMVRPEGCNPVAWRQDCMLPYPSDFFLVDDGSLPSGKRVELTEIARPRTSVGDTFDLLRAHPVDGFSRHQPILALFESGVSQSSLTFHTDPPAVSPSSTTVLLNARDGTPVPHWAELDQFTQDPARQVVVLRPYVRLEARTRYIVAFQNLEDASGRAVRSPDSYRELAQTQRYQTQVLAPLEEFGVDLDAIEIAWDFTTGSDAHVQADLLAMRADAIEFFSEPVRLSDITVTEIGSELVALRVEGTLEVPLYLESTEPNAAMHRGPDGQVARNGTAEVPFTVQFPQSALPRGAGFTPVRMLQWGHGFFGLREEINYGFNQRYAQEGPYAMAAVDWWGMSEPDVTAIVSIGTNLDRAFGFVDRLQQAMINQMALTRALQTTLAQMPSMRRFDAPLYDPDAVSFYGISQGHIFGVAAVALNPWLDRAVLGVGGGPYSLMMSRSSNFSQLLTLIDLLLADPVMTQKLIALSQHSWDRVDATTWAPALLRAPLPGSPQRHLLTHMGVGDHSVPNLASELLAREIGAPLLGPSAHVPFGFTPVEGPLPSAFVTVDFGVENLPGVLARLPTLDERNEVHDSLRDLGAIKAQVDAFLRPDGMVNNFCAGACDPE
jgi:hypothetical protein